MITFAFVALTLLLTVIAVGGALWFFRREYMHSLQESERRARRRSASFRKAASGMVRTQAEYRKELEQLTAEMRLIRSAVDRMLPETNKLPVNTFLSKAEERVIREDRLKNGREFQVVR